jgi:hypothetical protein
MLGAARAVGSNCGHEDRHVMVGQTFNLVTFADEDGAIASANMQAQR